MNNRFYILILPILFSLFANAQKKSISIAAEDIQVLQRNVEQGGFFVMPFEHIGDIYYKAVPSNLIGGDLQREFPDFKTFNLINLDGQLEAKLLLTKHKMYFTSATNNGFQSVYPSKNQSEYVIENGFDQKDAIACATEDLHNLTQESARSNIGYYTYGNDLQSFRLAVITTGEFYTQHGNNDSGVMADIVSTIGRINLIFERELSLNFTLSARVFMYKDPETDPFTPNLNTGTSLRTTQSASAFATQFVDSDYDLGVTFNALDDGWSGGGLAVIKAACSTNTGITGPSKAKIWASSLGIADNTFTSVVAHELGHAFGARHTINSDSEVCFDAISDGHSYEIGSGNTLMSYGGLCGDGQDYVQSDETINNYFHFYSLYSMSEHIKTLTCQNVLATDNTPPVLNVNPCDIQNFKVPLNTPFRVEADATDPEGNNLTFCWEQLDEDGSGTPTAGFLGSEAANNPIGPLFRGYPPSSSPERSFPRFFNYFLQDPFESLSQVERDITLRCTVRDNNSEGGIFASDELTVEVINAGPFTVEIDSLLDTIYGGETINVSWPDNGVSDLCEKVDVHLISLNNPEIVIPIGINVPFTELGIEYFVAPGFSIDGNFHIKVECHIATCFSFYNYSRPFYSQNNCPAPETFYLCGIDDVTADIGDESLVYTTQNFSGVSDFQNSITVNSEDPLVHFVRYDVNGDCEQVNFESGNALNRFVDLTDFQVAKTGIYRIENLDEFSGILVLDSDLFSTNNLCTSLVGANLNRGNGENPTSTLFANWLDIELQACTSYKLGITTFDTAATFGIKISGESLISVESNNQVDGDFYYVVENDEGIIIEVNVESDFTDLRQGDYNVYSIKVDAEVFNPNDFIGKRLIDFGLDGICIDRSVNTYNMLLINNLPDEDGDGYHTDEDCDDTDENINPGETEVANNNIDENCDGELLIIDEDEDGFNSADDCDDTNPDINSEAIEIANNDIDENCDGEILVIDEDGDGFNSDEDCDDTNADINPDAEEIINNDVDEDCDGVAQSNDSDMDGFNNDVDCDDTNPDINPDADEIPNNDVDENCDGEILIIDEDGDGFNSDDDCDDMNADINPNAEEIINNDIDEDCDGVAQSDDADMDGFKSDVDCDDTNPDINPDADEIPNNDVDENCDGEILIIDEDNDGFNSDDDCNDMDPNINPGANEVPNNTIDENCNGELGYTDEDMDGYNGLVDCNDLDSLINPGAEDIPNNGIDENCDGEDFTSGVKEFNELEIIVFPNPIVSEVFVDMADSARSFTLQNIQGQLFYTSSKFQGERTFFLGDLPSGMYIMSVYNMEDDLISTGKLIKI